MLGTGKTVVESLRNAQTATFRGIANTYDAAKEGQFSGAVEHVAAFIPGVQNLVDATHSGNMLNYVSASFAFGSHSDRATRYLHHDSPEMSPPDNPDSPESIFNRLNKREELI